MDSWIDVFAVYNSVLHSSVDSVVSHASHLITILPILLFFLLALELCIVHTTDFAFIIFS